MMPLFYIPKLNVIYNLQIRLNNPILSTNSYCWPNTRNSKRLCSSESSYKGIPTYKEIMAFIVNICIMLKYFSGIIPFYQFLTGLILYPVK